MYISWIVFIMPSFPSFETANNFFLLISNALVADKPLDLLKKKRKGGRVFW